MYGEQVPLQFWSVFVESFLVLMAHYLHGVQSWTPLRFYDTKWGLSGVVQCKVDHGFLYATNEFRLEIKSTQYLYVNLFINNQLAFNRDKIAYVFNEIYKYNYIMAVTFTFTSCSSMFTSSDLCLSLRVILFRMLLIHLSSTSAICSVSIPNLM